MFSVKRIMKKVQISIMYYEMFVVDVFGRYYVRCHDPGHYRGMDYSFPLYLTSHCLLQTPLLLPLCGFITSVLSCPLFCTITTLHSLSLTPVPGGHLSFILLYPHSHLALLLPLTWLSYLSLFTPLSPFAYSIVP